MSLDKKTKFKTYLLIALPVVLFNLIAVFGIDVLLKDDAYRYYNVLNGDIFKFKYIHMLIGHITHGITFLIMSFSAELIRVIYLLFVMVPISCLIYKLLHEKLGFPKIAAYTAAVLPNILPAQDEIPAFVNGTHVILGFLAVITCFFAIFKYLAAGAASAPQPIKPDDRARNRKLLFFAVFLYFLATMMMDQPIFSLPVLVFAAAGYFKFEKKHMFLTGFLLMVAAHKAAWMMLMPRGSTSMAAPAASFILERAGRYFLAMLPVPTAGMPREFKILTALFFVLIVVTGFFLHLRKGKKDPIFLPRPAFAHLSQPGFIFYIYGFLVTWVIGHIIVFATVSPRPFIVRYIYMAAFGLNALLVISLYPILKKVLRNKNKFIYLVFIIVILSAGISRFFQLHSYYSSVNRQQEKIVTKLKEIDPPQDAQVVVYLRGKAKNFWGVWKQSSGHLKHMMKRKDIDGLMGPGKVRYFNYYDAFNTKERGLNKKNRMRGLDLNRPLFLFAEKHDKLDQYEYALRWQRKEKDVLWTIFKLDKKNGGITALLSGQSRDEFRAAVKKLKQAGVARSEICWAGQPKYMDPKAWGGQPGKSGKETKSVPGNRL